MTEEFTGKPQRSNEEIRDSLSKINHDRTPLADKGELAGGMHKFDPLLISMFNSETAIHKCQNELRDEGIYTQKQRKGKRYALFVDFQDRGKAAEFIDKFQATHSDDPAARLKWDYAILIATIGGSIGTLPVMLTLRFESLIIAIGWGLLGFMIGWTVDRARWRRAVGRGSAFGLFDMMLVSAIIAMLMAMPGLWAFIMKN